ncbi:MAG: hypothetical protein ACLU5J_03330, partial [Christensenellales bacterium]
MPTNYSNVIVESFAKASSINYKLENVNGKLNLNKTIIDDAQPQYVEIGTIVGIEVLQVERSRIGLTLAIRNP